MPVARTIALPGDAAAWAGLGFAPGEPIGDDRDRPEGLWAARGARLHDPAP